MYNYFISNRDLIKDLAINKGTSTSKSFQDICTTSEVKVNTDLEKKDFYLYCDALKRQIVTGGSVTLTGTLKLDVNNEADLVLLDKIHTLIASGEVAQFTNQLIQFDLLSGVDANGVLEYTTYEANTTLTISEVGGNAEDEGELPFEFALIGAATEIASA